MFTFAFNFGMNILTPLIHTLAPATPSEGRQHWGCHSWIPPAGAGKTVGSTAPAPPPRKDLSARSVVRWVRAVSAPWWGSFEVWQEHGGGQGSAGV